MDVKGIAGKGGLAMPKPKTEVKPAIVESEDEDVSNEDYKDKDALAEEFFEDDEEENVEDGEATEDESSKDAIDVGDDF